MKVKSTFLFFLSVFLFSCASYVEGKKEEITIVTSPSGATVFIDKKVCLTLCDIEVSKKIKGFHIYKKGYHKKYVKLKKKISSWFWANLLFFPPGMLIDYKTGAM